MTRLGDVVAALDELYPPAWAESATDATRRVLLKPQVRCAMTAPALREVIDQICGLLGPGARVKVGIEAAGHYHRPLLSPQVWPAGWELLAQPRSRRRAAQVGGQAHDQDRHR